MTEVALEDAWTVPEGTPWLGDVLLGAVGAVVGDLPEMRLRPPGGLRSTPRAPVPGAQDLGPEELAPVISPSATEAQRRTGLPGAKRAVVVLVDGLGWHNLQARADLAPFLTSQFHGVVGQSAIPSTTAANVTFLGTGVKPGQTAMAGYTVRNPESGRSMNLISWAGGMDPLDWQRVPTVFERLAAAGSSGAHVSTWRFENSALTQAALRGAQYIAAETLEERVDATVDRMREGTTPIAYLYWADIDATGHVHGWNSPEWETQLRHLDAQVERLVRELGPETLVVVTADHGMVDVPLGESACFGGPARIDIAAHPELARDVTLVTGENRFIQLFTDSPGAVAERWQDFLGERAVVLTRVEGFTRDLFGPVRPDVAPVIGDVLVPVLGDLSIGDRRIMSEGMFDLAGLHGSLTEWERAVPILSLMTD